jgi:tetratricopeptide (TPR) repeat protein
MDELSAGQVIGGVVVGAAALAGWYFQETLKALLPTPQRLAGLMRRRDLPLPTGERFVVLIADLQGDDDKRTHTRHVAAALEAHRGLDVTPVGPGPEWGIESRDDFEAKARWLLAERRGDVLISGEVATAGKGLRLRILPSDASARTQRGSSDGRRPGEYVLTETGLPLDFDEDFNAVLIALIAASIAPATERQGHYLVDLLEPAAGKLKRLCDNMPNRLEPDQRGSLWHALGLAASTIGEQRGEADWLEQAVPAYRKALKERTRERVPLDWAMTQNNLGTALLRLGERESGTARLDEAVAAFREALKERTRERVLLQWATTQNNLGIALATLGQRESGKARLDEAVAAFREALKERTREKVPLQWAAAQNNLGIALATLGQRESGTARLDEAVAAFREALKERTREKVPLQWAATQNNLGIALAMLGQRESGTARLDEAVAAFRAALEERRRDRVPLDWAMTQNNLGNALATLGVRTGDALKLKEAREAIVAAFDVFMQAGQEHHRADFEKRLREIDRKIAELTQGPRA